MTLNARAPTPAQTAAIEQWARGMLALQPTHPRSHYLMGSAAVVNSSEGAPSSLRDPQLHMVRGLELARQQGSDLWIAWWATGAAPPRVLLPSQKFDPLCAAGCALPQAVQAQAHRRGG